MPEHFTILHSGEIDAIQWKQTLQKNSHSASIYMHAPYLDMLTDNWLAVVNHDYSIITAIPFKKKWNIPYAYTAPFVQATSIIGNTSTDDQKTIIAIIQKKLLYGTIALSNISPLAMGAVKTNFVLPLNHSYETLYAKYTSDLKHNINKAIKNELTYHNTNSIDDAMNLYISLNSSKTPHVQKEIYGRLKRYCEQNQTDYCIRSVKDSKGNLVAIALLLKKFNRIYNVLNSVTNEGRKLHANHWLFHKIIESFSNSNMTFDFEGSSIPGIRNFYKGFNPMEEQYTVSKFNLLPFPLSLLA